MKYFHVSASLSTRQYSLQLFCTCLLELPVFPAREGGLVSVRAAAPGWDVLSTYNNTTDRYTWPLIKSMMNVFFICLCPWSFSSQLMLFIMHPLCVLKASRQHEGCFSILEEVLYCSFSSYSLL